MRKGSLAGIGFGAVVLTVAALLVRSKSTPLEDVLQRGRGSEGKGALRSALAGGEMAGRERDAILMLGAREGQASPDGPFSVRIGDAWVLVEGAVERAALDELLKWLDQDNADLRWAAARVLRDSLSDQVVRAAFLARLGDVDGRVAAEAAGALGAWAWRCPGEDASRPAVVERLIASAETGDERVRFRLKSPLSSGAVRGEEWARLETMARSEGSEARLFAVEVLAMRPATVVPSVLLHATTSDKAGDVREAAALSLGSWPQDASAQGALVQALKSDADWEVRAAAARSLGRFPGPASVQALEAALVSDPRPEVRQTASRALHR